MPGVRTGTGTGAVEPKAFPLPNGVQAKAVMVGTGSSAVEVWSSYEPLTANGVIPQTQLPGGWRTLATWTAPRGSRSAAPIDYTVRWDKVAGDLRLRIMRNGVAIASSPGAPATTTQTLTTSAVVNAGDVFWFDAYGNNFFSDLRLVRSGSWSITEN